jgi:FkbM family methyltransferase
MIKQWKARFRQTPFWIRTSYSMSYQWLRMRANYNKWIIERNFYRELLGYNKVKLIMDVGANVGHKSFIFSKLADKVLAFEPSNFCLHILRSRFKGTNVLPISVALGSQEGMFDFYEIQQNEAYNSLSKKHMETTVQDRQVAAYNSVEPRKVPVEVVEKYIVTYGVPEYLKIDVEGFEIEVLRGLKSLVPLISFEANLPEFREEAIEGIRYLGLISHGAYRFKMAEDIEFLMDRFLSSEEAIQFLMDTSIRYIEIYARLKHQ